MSPKHFFAGLAIITIAQIVFCTLLIWWILPLRQHSAFIAVTVAAMIFFSILLYGAAKVYAKSSLVRLYVQLIMIAVFLKMLLCLALIIGYKKGFEPDDHYFIWPFLFIYLTSTVYEVVFLEKVGREKHTSRT
jgi:hypothetical protein